MLSGGVFSFEEWNKKKSGMAKNQQNAKIEIYFFLRSPFCAAAESVQAHSQTFDIMTLSSSPDTYYNLE